MIFLLTDESASFPAVFSTPFSMFYLLASNSTYVIYDASGIGFILHCFMLSFVAIGLRCRGSSRRFYVVGRVTALSLIHI